MGGDAQLPLLPAPSLLEVDTNQTWELWMWEKKLREVWVR